MLKQMKWMSLLISAIYIICGIVMLMYPEQAMIMFCDFFGIALIVFGIVNIVTYFLIDLKESLFRNDFSIGVIQILLGVMVIYQKDIFRQLIPFLLAIAIIISGISKLQDGIDASRIGYPQWWLYIVLSFISVGAGAAILMNLVPAGNLMMQVAGAALVYSGITDLYSTLYLSGKIKRFMSVTKESVESVKESFREVMDAAAQPEEEPEASRNEEKAEWNTGAVPKPDSNPEDRPEGTESSPE